MPSPVANNPLGLGPLREEGETQRGVGSLDLDRGSKEGNRAQFPSHRVRLPQSSCVTPTEKATHWSMVCDIPMSGRYSALPSRSRHTSQGQLRASLGLKQARFPVRQHSTTTETGSPRETNDLVSMMISQVVAEKSRDLPRQVRQKSEDPGKFEDQAENTDPYRAETEDEIVPSLALRKILPNHGKGEHPHKEQP